MPETLKPFLLRKRTMGLFNMLKSVKHLMLINFTNKNVSKRHSLRKKILLYAIVVIVKLVTLKVI